MGVTGWAQRARPQLPARGGSRPTWRREAVGAAWAETRGWAGRGPWQALGVAAAEAPQVRAATLVSPCRSAPLPAAPAGLTVPLRGPDVPRRGLGPPPARSQHGHAAAGGQADLLHLPGTLPGPGDATLWPQLLRGLHPGLVRRLREGVPGVPGALPRRRRAAPQRGAQRSPGGGARRQPGPRPQPGPQRVLSAAPAAARTLLPHRGPPRVQRVHHERVSPPRVGAAGR